MSACPGQNEMYYKNDMCLVCVEMLLFLFGSVNYQNNGVYKIFGL